jgi:Zn-dependent protease
MGGYSTETILSIAFIIFFGIGLHEYAHCKFADMAGDPTPSIYGRLTLNLTKHFEPIGTVMIIISSLSGYGIGWGRPAPMNPDKMRNPRWDFFMAVIAGPVSNLTQAVIYAFLAKVAISGGLMGQLEMRHFLVGDTVVSPIASFFVMAVMINLSLAFFNIIPLGPLDGHWLLGLLMPEKPRLKWFVWNRHYGRGFLIGLILLGQLLARSGHPEFDFIGMFLGKTVFPAMVYLLGLKG